MNYTDIEKVTEKNTDYRRVLYTTPNLQLVVMSLLPYEKIGVEKHNGTQFFRIEVGSGSAVISSMKAVHETHKKLLKPGISLTIPPQTYHNIIAGQNGLKLYTIYAPPQHEDGLIEKYKPFEN